MQIKPISLEQAVQVYLDVVNEDAAKDFTEEDIEKAFRAGVKYQEFSGGL